MTLCFNLYPFLSELSHMSSCLCFALLSLQRSRAAVSPSAGSHGGQVLAAVRAAVLLPGDAGAGGAVRAAAARQLHRLAQVRVPRQPAGDRRWALGAGWGVARSSSAERALFGGMEC